MHNGIKASSGMSSSSPLRVRNKSDGKGCTPSRNKKGLNGRAKSMLLAAVTLDRAMYPRMAAWCEGTLPKSPRSAMLLFSVWPVAPMVVEN